MAESNATTCEKKSQLTRDNSLRQTIQQRRVKIQDATPSEATQKFLEDLTYVETEYNGIPAIVAEYEEAYPDYKQSGSTYNTSECQWREIEKWDQGSGLDPGVKAAIKTLREEYYRDENETPLNTSHPKRILNEAVNAFRMIKSCLDQRTEEEEETVGTYDKTKVFKKNVEDWFTDLTALHKQAKDDYEKKKAKSLHAVYLEAAQVWYKITQAIKTPQVLKNDLMGALWSVLEAKHERYLWHKDWLKKQQAVTDAQAIYDTFKKNRRKDFFREAEDVEAAAGNSGNGGSDYGAGQGPSSYATPTTAAP